MKTMDFGEILGLVSLIGSLLGVVISIVFYGGRIIERLTNLEASMAVNKAEVVARCTLRRDDTDREFGIVHRRIDGVVAVQNTNIERIATLEAKHAALHGDCA